MGVLMRLKPCGVAVFLAAALWLTVLPVRAEESSSYLYEQKIKAGIIYNFLKLTTWPDAAVRAKGGLSVCLLGGDPFGGYLYPLEGKTAQQRLISITKIYSADAAAGCSLVFVHRNEADSLPDILKAVAESPALTVSDIEGFAEMGGMVELAKENEHISLYVNENEARASGIRISDGILKLAKRVSTKKS